MTASTIRKVIGAIELLLLVTAIAVVAGCGGGGSGGSGPITSTGTLSVRVQDVTGQPISGADVRVSTPGGEIRATTGADGVARVAGLPSGEVTVSVSAAGFVSGSFTTADRDLHSISLQAIDEWSVGSAIVLGTHMLERAVDGSTLTFSVDVAVINASSAAIESLTGSDFEVVPVDCSWFGPRECASDPAGNAPPSGGYFGPDGGAMSFGLQPPAARRPYLVGVLVERSRAIPDWNDKVPALKSFFTALGGNDGASLETVETINGSSAYTPLGPYTSDGRAYMDAIDRLPGSTGDPPALLDSLKDSIRRAAAARSASTTAVESTVLVLSQQGLTVAQLNEAAALARQLGVHVSSVGVQFGEYGLAETAVRTGGLAAQYEDPRRLGMIFGALDQLLAGTLPYYRMTFRIRGGNDTFVAGGNVKVWLHIRVPASIPNRGVYLSFDVAIS